MHPGKRNSLDALCDRYGISNTHRALYGALLDAELLAEVYLAMTRGQNSLTMDLSPADELATGGETADVASFTEIIVLRATEEELLEHEAVLARLDKEVKGPCIWHVAAANEPTAN